jgi:hypothetical protein
MKHNGHRMNPAAGRFLAAMRGAFDRPEPRKSTERRATEIVTREVLRAAKPATTAIQ